MNFQNNVSSEGTSIYGFNAKILLRLISMDSNWSSRGGCIEINNSDLQVSNSTFTNNKGLQGGVIFAIQRSFFNVLNSTLSNNMAEDGGIVYGMGNQLSTADYKNTDNLSLKSTLVEKNWSKQNLIHILLSTMLINDCKIVDNYAQFVTHGITLISS